MLNACVIDAEYSSENLIAGHVQNYYDGSCFLYLSCPISLEFFLLLFSGLGPSGNEDASCLPGLIIWVL